jgi:hypothetical protein
MRWEEALKEEMAKAGGIVDRIDERDATRIARLFFDQEVYPRVQSLRGRLKEYPRYEVLLWPDTPPPEGTTWLVHNARLSVYLSSSMSEIGPPLASISFDYRIALVWDVTTHTKEGRSNSLVFAMFGEAVRQVELALEDFAENLGVTS